MNLNETLRFMYLLTLRTYTMVRMIAAAFYPDNEFLHECDEWFERELKEQETQIMIDDLYRGGV